MAFCGNCGAQAQNDVKYCPSCGAAMGAPMAGGHQSQDQPYAPPIMPGAPAQADIKDAQDNKGMAVLSYILFFIPLLTGAHRTSAFVRYHANQGTVLFIGAMAWGIAEMIVSAILSAIFLNAYTWGLWGLLSTVLGLLWLVPAALCAVGIINAVNGRMKPLPFIGGFSVIK